MKCRSRVFASVIVGVVWMSPALLHAAPFTPGNLAVMRVGTGSGALGNAATALFIDEYTDTGTLVQSIALPTTASAGVNACTLGGSATSEGHMTLSADSQFLVSGCYSSALGTATPSGVAPTTAPRILVRVGANGAVDTTTAIGTAAASGALRGVASSNGDDLWFGTAGGGSFYATHGGSSATQLYTTLNNSRTVQIADGQLYGSSGSGTFRLFTIGTGLPTTGGQTITNLNGLPTAGVSPYAFFFADLSVTEPGIDTVYLTDDTGGANGGIRKFSLSAGTWTQNGTQINTGLTTVRGLTGSTSGTTVTLFATNSGNSLVTLVDTAGHGAAPSATSGTSIASAPSNTAFRGVAFVPSAAQPSLTIAAASVLEGDSPGCTTTALNFTVTSDTAAPGGGIGFTFSTADGSATLADSDYTQVSGGAGTIAAGQTTGTATVNVTCDKKAEANETLTVNLIDGGSYNLGLQASATGTINDDDTPVLTVADVSQNEGDSGTSNMTFTVQLDRPAPTGGVSYSYTVASITAAAGSDFGAVGTLPGSVAAGNTSQQHSVVINGDTDFEDDETLSFTVSGATQVAAAGNDFAATGTILNDDISTLPSIAITDVSQNEGNSGPTTFSFQVTLNAPAGAGGATFDIATSNGTATLADDDYVQKSLTGQTIAAGNTTYAFTVTVNGDTAFEANESFNVTITPGAGISGGGNDLAGIGTIVNDDTQPTTLSIGTPTAMAEGDNSAVNTTMTFAVTLDAPAPAGGVTFNAASSDGTATTANNDYVALPSTQFTINAGQITPTTPVRIAIRGDIVNEGNETFTVTLSNITGTNASLGTATATGTINNDDPVPRTLAELQGTGTASPFDGTVQSSFGNVVTAVGSNIFAMQMPGAGDGNAFTSDAVLVFTGGAPTVAVGNVVNVKGNLVEFFDQTEFTTTGGGLTVNVVGTAALPNATLFDSIIPSPAPSVPACQGAGSTIPASAAIAVQNFECYESMLVTTATGMINSAHQNFGGATPDPIAENWFATGGARVRREAGVDPAVAGEAGLPAGVAKWDGNPELFEIDVDRLNLPSTVLIPGTSVTASGVIGYEFNGYELWATSLSINGTAPVLPRPTPAAGVDQLSIGSFNVENLFDTVDDPTKDDDIPTPAELDLKLGKLSAYIRTVLNSPAVLGIIEVENQTVLNALAARIAADDPAIQYTAVIFPGNDPRGINNAFLHRNVTVAQVAQLRLNQMTNECSTTPPCRLHDRPTLRLAGTFTKSNGQTQPFAVMVSHLRSLSGIDNQNELANANRVRRKRLEQAVAVAQDTQSFQSTNPSVPLVSLGDFNAFEFTDGYADVMGIVRGDANVAGDPTPRNTQYEIQDIYPEISGNIVSPPMSEALFNLPPDQRYSFMFGCNSTSAGCFAQALDHTLLSAAAQPFYFSFSYGRGNADARASDVTVPLSPLGTSDHDGSVLILNFSENIFGNGFE